MGHSSRECPKPRDYSKVRCKNCNERRFASELQLSIQSLTRVVGHTAVRCKAPKPETDTENAAGDGDGWGGGADTAAPAANGGGWQPAGDSW